MVKWIIAACVLLVGGTALAGGPPVVPMASRHFDHDRHASSAAAGGKQLPCSGCHTVDASGAFRLGREHDRCAGCHNYPASCTVMQTTGVKAPARVCQVCHTATRPECLPKDLPPIPREDSFAAKFTHGKHLQLGSSIERDCAQCHKPQAGADAKTVGGDAAHKLCAGCHNAQGAKPPMTECAGCHVAPKPKLAQAPDPFRLTGFDHRAHQSASKQQSCLGCHDKLVGAGEAQLPRPSMLGCQTKCHDGQKAFTATGTHCTACHKATDKAPPFRTDLGFGHKAHAGRNVKIADCGSCHALKADGTLTSPGAGKDHAQCSAAGCHQNEFVTRGPKICGICHAAAVPWVKATSRAPAPINLEWFEHLDHAAHLAKGGTSNGSCAACHGDKLAGAAEPHGHETCAQCHSKANKPAMTDCAGCHTQQPSALPVISAWSVAPNFAHAKHATDPRSRAITACTECHKEVVTAKTLPIATPKMASCDGCHDGKAAFKTTGFDCVRCHAPKPSAPATARFDGAGSHAPKAPAPLTARFDATRTGELRLAARPPGASSVAMRLEVRR